MSDFIQQAQAIKEDIVNYRRTIHNNAEVGADLPKTKAYVMDKLRKFGYEPTEICQSGIVATIEGIKPGKPFLLRADMDALPMGEDTACDFKSTNGYVKLVFQPDEEGFTGAKKMIEAGVLQNLKVDAAMAVHAHSVIPSNVVYMV